MQKQIRADHVAIYIRWSSDDQAIGTTLEVQREGCEFYLRSQGWVVRNDLVFIDEGYSGGNLDRPGMTLLRELVRRGEVDCVVVLKIDRLSRNIVDAVDLVLREWDGRCYLKSVREPIDTTTDLGRVIFGILAMFADFERSQIRDRTQSGKTKRIREGKQLHGRPCYGYQAHPTEKGQWIENHAESELVRRIFQMAADGLSTNQIARRLNNEGLRTRNNKAWSHHAIWIILKNPVYVGEVVYGRSSLQVVRREQADITPAGTLAANRARKKYVRVFHAEPKVSVSTKAAPPLVDRETYDKVQELLERRCVFRREVGSRASASKHLLVGLAKCVCGGALIHKVQSGRLNRERGWQYHHYICSRSREGLCKANGHIPAEVAEQTVEAIFLRLYGVREEREERFLPYLQTAQTDQRALVEALRGVEEERKRLDADERRILREARRGDISMADMRDLRESIAADRKDLDERAHALQQQLGELDTRLRSLQAALTALNAVGHWRNLEPWQKRQLLRMVLRDRITILKPKGRRQMQIDAPWAF